MKRLGRPINNRRQTMRRQTLKTLAGLLTLAALAASGSAFAETKLKWAHVYDVSES